MFMEVIVNNTSNVFLNSPLTIRLSTQSKSYQKSQKTRTASPCLDNIKRSFAIINKKAGLIIVVTRYFVCLFDLILYVHSIIFQLCGTGLPGLNQY